MDAPVKNVTIRRETSFRSLRNIDKIIVDVAFECASFTHKQRPIILFMFHTFGHVISVGMDAEARGRANDVVRVEGR